MPRLTREQKLEKVHADAIKQFSDITSATSDERDQSVEDRRFYSIAGAQWEGDLEEQFANKPRFEVNKIHLAVIRIINEYRSNRISVNYKSKDGSPDDNLSDLCNGMYRACEQDSTADEAYDNAFEEGASGGFGAWRLTTEYEDEEDPDNETQCIKIDPIFDADTSVYFDLNAKRQDKKDANYCFVITPMTRASYEDSYDDDPSSWSTDLEHNHFDWSTPDYVYVAEYFVKEKESVTVHYFESINGDIEKVESTDLEEVEEDLIALGYREQKIRKVKRTKVRKYILSGGKVLEDCGYIAGQEIPIVPFYGKRWFVSRIERFMGHVRLAKDAQVLKNIQLSKLGEIASHSSIEKPILTPEQVAGHQDYWENDSVQNFAYMLINPITNEEGQEVAQPPIGYTKSPSIPQSLAALLQITEEDMNDILGNNQGGETIEGNISTETAFLVQNRLDMQTYIYISNFAKAMKRSGEIWLSMAKDVYVEEGRKVKSIGSQDETDTIELVKPIMADGKTEYDNDLPNAKFDVVVDVGATSSTRRQATIKALTNLLSISDDQETKQVLGSMIMMNMEGEGVSEVRGYFRKKLLRMGVVDPTEEEKKEMAEEQANRGSNPNDDLARAMAAEQLASAEKKQAETLKTSAQTNQIRAETAETIADMQRGEIETSMKVIDELGSKVVPTDTTGAIE